MGTFTVYTVGGGPYLMDFFNGVAALMGSGTFGSLAHIMAGVAIAWLAFQTALTHQWAPNIRYMVTYTALVGVLFAPKVDVQIVDTAIPTFVGGNVANVPFGLASFASWSSIIGNGATTGAEAIFSLPSDLTYTQNGMIFGSKIEQAATQLQITNSELAGNVNSFIQQCVFYSILLGQMSFDELKSSPNIWQYVTQTVPPSPARSFNMTTGGVSSIVTCQAGAQALNTQWTTEINNDATIFGLQMFPYLDSATAQSQLLSELPIAHQYIVGAARSAAGIMQQAMMVNALQTAMQGMAGSADATTAMQVYAQTKSDMQTQSTYQTVGALGAKWLPLLKIVTESLLYASFPIAFLLMMLPNGMTVARGYFASFIWVQSWGPLYAVLNRIMTGYAATTTQAAGVLGAGTGADFSLVSMAGIQGVQNDVAALAGYLSMSIPVIAGGIARGVWGLSGTLSGALQVPSSAAGQAAGEAVTGNVSLGNTSMYNDTFNTMRGNQVQTSAYADSGYTTWRDRTGAMNSITPDGRFVTDMSGAGSRMPVDINLGHQLANEQRAHGEQLTRLAQDQTTRAGESYQAGFSKVAELASLRGRDHHIDDQLSHGQSATFGQDLSDVSKLVGDFATRNHISKENAWDVIGRAYARISGGIGIPGTSIGIEGGTEVSGSLSHRHGNTHIDDAAEQLVKDKSFSTKFDKLVQDSSRIDGGLRSYDGTSFRDAISGNFSHAKQYENMASANMEKANYYSVSASRTEANSASVSEHMQQPYFEWLSKQRIGNNGPMGPEGAVALYASTRPEDMSLRRQYEHAFVQEQVVGGGPNFGLSRSPESYKPTSGDYHAAAGALGGPPGYGDVTTITNQAATSGALPKPGEVASRVQSLGTTVNNGLAKADRNIGAGRTDVNLKGGVLQKDVTNAGAAVPLPHAKTSPPPDPFAATSGFWGPDALVPPAPGTGPVSTNSHLVAGQRPGDHDGAAPGHQSSAPPAPAATGSQAPFTFGGPTGHGDSGNAAGQTPASGTLPRSGEGTGQVHPAEPSGSGTGLANADSHMGAGQRPGDHDGAAPGHHAGAPSAPAATGSQDPLIFGGPAGDSGNASGQVAPPPLSLPANTVPAPEKE